MNTAWDATLLVLTACVSVLGTLAILNLLARSKR